MNQEERIFAGIMFNPGDTQLRAIKKRSHDLSQEYSRTYEEEKEKRAEILQELLGEMGEGVFMQGPIFFHYGKHTKVGNWFFANYNLTVQDDAKVTIGDGVMFGPNVTIVTPVHPMVASERGCMYDENGNINHLCYAKPVTIGNDVWLGANVTVCGGVKIGNGCVIGAGSVVTRDIPDNCFAAGVPCKVIREITDADSMRHHPEILEKCRLIEKE